MSKKSLIFCLIVSVAIFYGGCHCEQKTEDKAPIDANAITWFELGTFSEFETKEVREIWVDNFSDGEEPTDVVFRFDSKKDIAKIAEEIMAKSSESKSFCACSAKIWFIFSDGTGYGFEAEDRDNSYLLTDSSGEVRASSELLNVLIRTFGPEPEEEEIPHPSPRDFWIRMDLRKSMPKGNFLEASIVELDHHGNVVYVRFKIPKGKMSEFQTGFGPCIIEARKDAEEARKKAKEAGEKPLLKLPYDPIGGITKLNQLRIITDMGAYMFYLTWTDDYVRFNGLMSKDFRKVLSDVGFKGAE